MQGQRVGLAADVSGDYRDRAEFAQRAGGAEDHAVEQSPFDIGQRDAEKHLPTVGAQHHGGFFFVGALRFHQRDQFARDEGERDEGGGQNNSGDGEDDGDVVLHQPGAEPALRAEDQHENESGDHGRHAEGDVDQRGQHVLSGELEFGDGPRGG